MVAQGTTPSNVGAGVTPAGQTASIDGVSSLTPGNYTMRWLLAWAVAIALFLLAIRTRIGYTTAYYLLALMLVLLLVTQSKWLTSVIAPITGGSRTVV